MESKAKKWSCMILKSTKFLKDHPKKKSRILTLYACLYTVQWTLHMSSYFMILFFQTFYRPHWGPLKKSALTPKGPPLEKIKNFLKIVLISKIIFFSTWVWKNILERVIWFGFVAALLGNINFDQKLAPDPRETRALPLARLFRRCPHFG